MAKNDYRDMLTNASNQVGSFSLQGKALPQSLAFLEPILNRGTIHAMKLAEGHPGADAFAQGASDIRQDLLVLRTARIEPTTKAAPQVALKLAAAPTPEIPFTLPTPKRSGPKPTLG